MTARVLMVQGTASGVGKSLITAALCRLFVRAGIRVAPFKAQNMSNNAAVTIEGGEIGRAQALQARAARVQPHVHMNPVLLKPLADRRSDVVVLGQSRPDLIDIPWHERKAALWPCVTGALDQLRETAELVIIEGAGSPAETNLRHSDIVNMAVARHADAPVILVADIDRGGAFASLYGTWSLLEAEDRRHVRAFLLNKFRGDAALLAPAPTELEQRTGVPTIGVMPYVRHDLPDEDAFSMRTGRGGAVRVAAIRLPHVANFDDLDPIACEPGVHVQWTVDPDQLRDAAAVVLPGTRNTLADLAWLWETGLAAAIRARAAASVQVIGLCGGYQMLGDVVRDPLGIEAGGEVQGLGLLPVTTELGQYKQTRPVTAVAAALPFASASTMTLELHGYEIHHGVTRGASTNWLEVGQEPAGSYANTVWGTYLHGIFNNDAFRAQWLASLKVRPTGLRWELHIERELDTLADTVAANIDLPRLHSIIGLT
jgi:adenosylcobyric acid synthase